MPTNGRATVWVLIRRYEWESQSNQTECCDTFVFARKRNAILKAQNLLRSDMKKFGWSGLKYYDKELNGLLITLWDNRKFPRHLVKLTDDDNVVYELYSRKVK